MLFLGSISSTALAAPRECHLYPMLAIGREHTMQARQVDTGVGYQGSKPGQKIQRFDKIARSDFEQPKAGPQGEGQDARSNMT